ncbi:MBL fold metallo-hydrolase [Paenibacillus sp. Marseille-Q4541]|uniref:MBL fold metallo-hydrolase n=1 Tax=Paenibacillus sp. Marseille-Q4541 TaxID=2831522 RepID=UPI001BAE3886|nr:MBL fold metallo-hydrolase [Paenibacillus sp. Marseille-Q4541]
MKVKILATGSDGNCVWISNGKVNILVDVGLPARSIEKIMLENDVNPSEVKAIFVTHEHKDHVSGVGIAKKYLIPVYGSEGTLKKISKLEGAEVMNKQSAITFGLGSPEFMTIKRFDVHHDALEPTGFVIESAGEKVSVLMDTGKVTPDMIHAMSYSDIYIFECNHDEDMLANGEYHDSLKARVLSDSGHLSNKAAAEALSKLIKGKGEQIYLTHMSSKNNLPALAERIVKRALRQRGYEAGTHYSLVTI